jgi:tellurite resistance protein
MSYLKWTLILIIATPTIFSYAGQTPKTSNGKIQIAFLLDVSGSMEQLILKAKSQFWRLANYLETATKKGKKPTIEFSIIIYGLDYEKDLCRILTNFNSDLDSVAMNLHDIQIGGGTEYCWTTINIALDRLNWSKQKGDLKLIIIAGNESFSQEQINSKMVIDKAKRMNVVINTIYCSATAQDSISYEWKSAAEQANGNYFSISLNDSLNIKDNSLDKKLSDFNEKLNETYVPFGPTGQRNFYMMILQDNNSKMAGMPFFRERVIFKASDSFKNPTWDLVDAVMADSTILTRLDFMKDVITPDNKSDLIEFINSKHYLRESYKEVIRLRYEMIKKSLGENKDDRDLDLAVVKIIDKEGRKRNFKFREE